MHLLSFFCKPSDQFQSYYGIVLACDYEDARLQLVQMSNRGTVSIEFLLLLRRPTEKVRAPGPIVSIVRVVLVNIICWRSDSHTSCPVIGTDHQSHQGQVTAVRSADCCRFTLQTKNLLGMFRSVLDVFKISAAKVAYVQVSELRSVSVAPAEVGRENMES